jgi:hypothetical protein
MAKDPMATSGQFLVATDTVEVGQVFCPHVEGVDLDVWVFAAVGGEKGVCNRDGRGLRTPRGRDDVEDSHGGMVRVRRRSARVR